MKKNLSKELQEKLHQIIVAPAKVNVGKNGLTTGIFTEIKTTLERDKFLKVKFLKNFPTEDLETDIQTVTREVKAELMGKRGNTIILYKA